MRNGWDIKRGTSPNFMPLKVDSEEALIGLDVLKGLRHSITIAPLYRFYQHALDAAQDTNQRERRTEEFVEAIKATVAFSVLWRAAKGGTENIDSHYRRIMRTGIDNIAGQTVPPLARRPNEKSGALSLSNYRKALRLILVHKGNIRTKDDWVRLVSSVGVYKHSTTLARFLLFCASDDATPDQTEKGLIKRGRPSLCPMLTLSQWNNDLYFTVLRAHCTAVTKC